MNVKPVLNIERQHRVYEMAVVGETGHLTLASQFACRCEPRVEKATSGHCYRERRQENGTGALGLIIAVFFAETAVESCGETGKVDRRFGKFDEPLVTAF